ncbi:MAG: hypothetical protein SGJ18_07860 [Pseudomonadota bacterium]|nr:hypothetical protein [Pseudomonadota bacterium]
MISSTLVLVFLTAVATADDWEHHKSSLQKLSTEIEMREKELKELIVRKKLEKDRGHSQELLKEIEEKHKQGEKSLVEFNKEVEHIKYRHPGREAENGTRSYSIITPRTVEDIESDTGVDGKLDKLKQKMKSQYGNFSTENESDKSEIHEKIPEKVESQRIIIKK